MTKNVFSKTLSILITFAMLLALLPGGFIVAHAESGWCGDNLTWNLDSAGRLTISGTGDMWDYDYWADSAPWGRNIISATIGNSVTSIGERAFGRCYSLTSVKIPDSVTSIGKEAFEECTGLTSVTIGNGVTSIGWYAFFRCTNLTSVTIGNSVTSIGDNAFCNCTSLTSVTIPDSVTSIGEEAFAWCKNLTSITIPNSLTSIGDYAFVDCSGLASIGVISGNPVYYGAGNCLIERETETLIVGCKNSVIPSDGSVTSIGDGAFRGCQGLTSITIPDGVTSIGGWAFQKCTGLRSITIPDSVTSIGICAFDDCTGLTSITIPNSVTSIGYHAFYNTSYYNNTNNWQNSVLYIDKWLIEAKDSISGSYSIKVDTIGIADGAFDGCDDLTGITIPDSVTSIGNEVFRDCWDLISVTIPNGVTSIGDYAFAHCWNLTNVTMPSGLKSIGVEAFLNCSDLTSVTIPISVTYIGENAFSRCNDFDEYYPLGVTLCVYQNSCAHRYAINNGFKYELISYTVTRGDMDGDGEITVADALRALRIAAKLAEETPEALEIGDIDGDGVITVADALKILRVAAKLATSL